MKKIINTKSNIDYTKQPYFLGEGLGIQRYDVFKNKTFYNSFLNQISFFWRPEEIDLGGKERIDFKNLSESEKFIFTQNLKYQILLDSIQARGIKYLLDFVSNPELEAAMNSWIFFEQIHSYSYTYIIKNVYSSPEEVFDNILTDKEIVKRATSVTAKYNDLINSLGDSKNDLKKKLYLTLVSINILEGIRFYVSFACSYCFAQNKKMEGNAKIINFINRDENLHLGITQTLLKALHKDDSEGFVKIAKSCEDIVYQMYRDAAQEECEWAEYLFAEGRQMLGLNADILIRYMQWLTNKRLRGIGKKILFPGASNPINWIDSWTVGKNVQIALQEAESESYKIGSFKQDINTLDVDEFDF
jgi:ribonucleoside-diphosphate reductase beta chain